MRISKMIEIEKLEFRILKGGQENSKDSFVLVFYKDSLHQKDFCQFDNFGLRLCFFSNSNPSL
jgi:hypothetical protein